MLVAIVKRIVKATATYSVPMGASELLRPQHRVHEVHERGDAQQQRQQSHDVTYTRSQSMTKPTIAANVASPSTTIPTVNMARPFASVAEPDSVS